MNTAKVFQSGNSQAIRLPKKFRFSGKRVFIRQFGEGVLLEPEYPSNSTWLDNLQNLSGDLFENRNQPEQVDVREEF